MACTSCKTGSCGTEGGCGKSGGCSTGGCNKLNAFDWLNNMGIGLADAYDIVELRFKNGRKEFYKNSELFELYTGDPVVVEMTSGYHIGYVSLQGEIVRLQMKRKQVKNDDQLKNIVRKASQKDIEKFLTAQNREVATMYRARTIILEQKLEMKLTDVEYQADNTKATFYYSADERVDFRELIKTLASEFKVRVEMKQISLRHEAARLGGIGSCGRELCCSTWIADFKNVNTSAARYQNLSLNPSKLSGQCGRLKCCLNYELDTYLDALKGIPEIEKPLQTEKGLASLQKTDIFRRIMWFAYESDTSNWVSISVDRVNEVLKLNTQNQKPATLEQNSEVEIESSVLLKEKNELSRFDDKFQAPRNNKKKKKKPNPQNRTTEGATPKPAAAVAPKQVMARENIVQTGDQAPAGDKPKKPFKKHKKFNSNNKPKPNNNENKTS
jgi:cell fate regulator YaaT (PSP1 superfamily)